MTMTGLTLGRIAQACGGTLHVSALTQAKDLVTIGETVQNGEDPRMRGEYNRLRDTEISSVTTDSRTADGNCLFAAIAGERADGHKFISAVYALGAVCVISERNLGPGDLPAGDSVSGESAAEVNESGNPAAAVRRTADAAPVCRAWIKVCDTLTALGDIAGEYLRILGIPVVGITGSVGKTSTKEMIASVLSTKLRTLKTAGNFNNDLGVPLTVFRLRSQDEIAVLELGISHFGEMHRLAEIARPDTAVITNIGTCHLEFLKDRDGVLKAKTEIFESLRPGGTVILNGNDDKLRTVSRVGGKAPLFFGVSSNEPQADGLCAGEKINFPGNLDPRQCVYAVNIKPRGFDGSVCTMKTPQGDFEVKIPVPGIHSISNAAAAAAVGLIYGLTPDQIRTGIESVKTISGRFRILSPGSMTVIDDCYNANPVSMKASLNVLHSVAGRRVAILGDMGELGEDEVKMHEEVGRYAADRVDKLIAIGPLARYMYDAARQALAQKCPGTSGRPAPGPDIVCYGTVAEFLAKKDEELLPGDTVLVKASHFMQFPQIVGALTQNA